MISSTCCKASSLHEEAAKIYAEISKHFIIEKLVASETVIQQQNSLLTPLAETIRPGT